MKETKPAEKAAIAESRPVFAKDNYKIMVAGLVVIVIGFLLMMGGASNDPNTFKPEEVYSFRRITLAPVVIVLGLLIEVVAIMRKPKA
ncbi:DUF3098 domain-containing protein [Chitinophaga agrisoli]|uniref:DUF3098 domain-containing protein n=1 Tax=Chitinophaga agrisoli TaxID=2607653 RepID=A0A5B2W5M0_9BACT|nr:DUF3098 domain-containing protein [Chitinophaga agrisoli]